jgi:hypothetical protein
MLDEHVEFLERIVVEQKFDALARGELALGVLRRDALLAAADSRRASRRARICFIDGSGRCTSLSPS